jgi:uncharacterized protein (TIGR02466 family)
MKIIKNEWWTTPIWEIETDFDSNFNKKLLEEIHYIKQQDKNKAFNIWDFPGENLQKLKQFQIDIIQQETKEYFEDYFNHEIVLSRGWLNVNVPNTSMAIHGHGGSILASTYYIQSEEDSGDLVIVDPRGSHGFRKSDEKFIYKKIKPKEGKIVFFPGFLAHSVEQNLSQKSRISLSSNVFVKSDGYKNIKTY